MIKVVVVNPESDKPLCVCGCVNNEAGQRIAFEMEEWLIRSYRLVQIWHDGRLFEQPALRYLQAHCMSSGEPALYIHTRGAFNRWKTTQPTHRMWEHEFGQFRDKYFNIVRTDKPTAACPFTGANKHTWYNGFVANAAAFAAIPEIVPNADRMVFERIFKGSDVNVVGTIFNNIDDESKLPPARRYLFDNYLKQ